MSRHDLIQGELQEHIMRVLWEIGRGTVDDVRRRLPEKQRGAYTTVQTILNRLADRGLLGREKRGKALVYEPKITEADYVSNALSYTLSAASEEARLAALASLVGGLDAGDIREINSLAEEIAERRTRK